MKSYLKAIVLLATFLTACNLAVGADAGTIPPGPNSPPKSDANTVQPVAPTQPVVDSIVATVNGVDIKESEVNVSLKPQLEQIARQVPPSFVEKYKSQIRQQTIDRMIIERLLDEKVKDANIIITEDAVMERIKQMAAQQQPPLSLEDFKSLVEAYGKSFDEVKQRIRQGLGYERLMENQWTGKIDVNDSETLNYYSENKKRFETPEEVRASHILIRYDTSDPNADPNQTKAKALAKAEELLKQIKGGADFAELAKTNSSCPSAAQGGDLNYFGRGQMVPSFEKAAFELKPGQVSDVVETQFGYHLIKVTDHKDPNIIPYDQVKGDIVKIIRQTKQKGVVTRYIESLKSSAKIVYPPGKEPSAPASPVSVSQNASVEKAPAQKAPAEKIPADTNAVAEPNEG